jgi:NADPH-dependent 2,4-dienoyl-CoA reductase/sulfur reductase-like enzyme
MARGVGKRACDVAVIGGGPAGISACLELSKSSNLDIALFESEAELGGIPRSSHIFFGLRDLKGIYTGRRYAGELTDLVRKTSVEIHVRSTVVGIIPGSREGRHQINVTSPEGLDTYESQFVLLATGCYEGSRESRFIPGTRPAGIFTTGTLQKMVNLQRLRPGKKALIVGTEHVAFSSALTLRRAGVPIVGIVEEDRALQTYPIVARAMSLWMSFPIYTGTSVEGVFGGRRVEGVELVDGKNGEVFRLPCDMVVVTGKFRPDSALIFDSPIEEDPLTSGPIVDLNLQTSVPTIFAAGNILRGANMHDLCALEGRQAARSILRVLKSPDLRTDEWIPIRVEPPIRYVVPQRIIATQAKTHRASWFSPGVSIQLAHTIKNAVLEAFAGNERVWRKSYSRLIANTTIALPIERFEWSRVDPGQGIALRAKIERT